MDTDQCQTVLVHLPNHSVVYDFFREVHLFYKPIHTYLSIIMCIFGTIANFCNIVVLTRRQMRTPVNMILTAMACCDTVVLFSNLVYTTHYQFVAFKHCHPRHWSYGWALFLIAHAHLSLVGHSSSVWLSVMLALIRYMTLRSRGNAGGMQIGLTHSYLAIGATICFIAIVNAPNFLTYKIHEIRLNDTCVVKDPSLVGAAAYLPGIAEIALARHCLVFRLVFWISGLVFKVIPCCLLSLFVWLLLGILKEVKANRQRLLQSSHSVSSNERNGKNSLSIAFISRVASRERADRTTNMLLAIVFVMLFTEMPQGIMALLSGMVSQEFRRHIYNNLGDLLDLFSLCEACMSFIIYCSMSGQFRNEFRRVFIPKSMHCPPHSSPSMRRPSEAYMKMTHLRPNDIDENGSYSHYDSDKTGVIKVGEQRFPSLYFSTLQNHMLLATTEELAKLSELFVPEFDCHLKIFSSSLRMPLNYGRVHSSQNP
uniref:G_PROTEIN_RECEP_F1_2 domain-containing protein n=1 Tax=Angiostrongylus cantonensis TaxID=6313 RepID=A0A0K0DE59_ANGCA